MGPATSLFRFEAVRVELNGVTILDGVDVGLPDGGITVLSGPSGAGKSTMLRLCNRLAVPTAGRVLFREDDLAAVDVLHHRRRVGMVFQQPTLFDGSVVDNLRVADPALDDEAAAAALDRVGLPAALLGRAARDLSGGEAQRACVARALATGPTVLLMDEPTAMLDHENTLRLEGLARRLVDEAGMAMVWVSHDDGQRRRLADWVVQVEGGRVLGPGGQAA